VIQAGVLVSAFAFVLLNLIVDALHGLVDPRIRTSH
jgi:peptide/nickel transport system permease protein